MLFFQLVQLIQDLQPFGSEFFFFERKTGLLLLHFQQSLVTLGKQGLFLGLMKFVQTLFFGFDILLEFFFLLGEFGFEPRDIGLEFLISFDQSDRLFLQGRQPGGILHILILQLAVLLLGLIHQLQCQIAADGQKDQEQHTDDLP